MRKSTFPWYLVIVLGLMILFTVFLYVWTFGTHLSQVKEEWGSFGDYFGGILGTILAALTIYLLYQTYSTQKEQLNTQRKDFLVRYVDLQYDQIIKDINEISYNNFKGSDALYKWDEQHTTIPNNVVNTLNFILHTFNNHIITINTTDFDNSEKEDFCSRAYLMIHSKIIWPVLAKLYNDSAFKGHTDNLYQNFNEMIKNTYRYLVPKNKLSKPQDERLLELMPEYKN
jgi:hypothetical protein